jgi:hypothetical protein
MIPENREMRRYHLAIASDYEYDHVLISGQSGSSGLKNKVAKAPG